MNFMSFENLPEFLNPLYWVTMRPASVAGVSGRIAFTIFIVIFIIGVVVRVMSSKQVDKYKTIVLTRTANLFVTMGLLGGLLYFFSNERIQFFGGRFWYPLWVIGFLVWGGFILRYAKKRIPEMKAEAKERREKRKYLPKRKKKK